MADKIRANYPAMEDMAKHMELVKNRLVELTNTSLKISSEMEGGVLQGQPGEAFAIVLALLAVKAVTLAQKADDQAKGIRAAISDMEQADSSAAGDFK